MNEINIVNIDYEYIGEINRIFALNENRGVVINYFDYAWEICEALSKSKPIMIDSDILKYEIENYKIQLRKLYHNKDTILSDMDSIDYEDKHYQRRKTDLENHLYKTYDKIDDAEELMVSAKAKKHSLLADKITGDNIYKALIFFDKLYAQMNEVEKREFLSQLVDNVQIYEERKENGQWLKSIEFKLPIIEKEFTLSLDNDTQNEAVCLLSRKER